MSAPDRLTGHVEEAIAASVAILDLPEHSALVLRRIALVQMDAQIAEATRDADVHGRAGVLPWTALLDLPEEAHADGVEAVTDWGLVQVVGQGRGDPVIPGAAALRLTHAGRVACGLAPRRLRPATPQPTGWELWHSASREALLIASGADTLISAAGWPSDDLSRLTGAVATRLLSGLPAIVDATGAETPADFALLEGLLLKTAAARGQRRMLLHDPAPLRWAAMRCGADLRWVEPEVEQRRDRQILDSRVGAALRASKPSAREADLVGVPYFELAIPRRVHVRWDELMLPAQEQRQLELALAHARYRLAAGLVGGRGGYRLLLSGQPGTGKSLAACALATTLDRPVLQIDLSVVLSKWLGETEQHLARIFDVAEAADAVLVLDEADALLRQRDSRQGGGLALSTAVGYLLSRLDRYRGALIATTNRLKDIEEAFFRRFDDLISLPVPDAPTRRALWSRALPAGHGVDLDYVAGRFPISGGLVFGAALRARAWSGALDRALDTPVALASLVSELEKSDRSATEILNGPHRDAVRALLDVCPVLRRGP